MRIWSEATICCLKLSSWDWRKLCNEEASEAEMPVEGAAGPRLRDSPEDDGTEAEEVVDVGGAVELMVGATDNGVADEDVGWNPGKLAKRSAAEETPGVERVLMEESLLAAPEPRLAPLPRGVLVLEVQLENRYEEPN